MSLIEKLTKKEEIVKPKNKERALSGHTELVARHIRNGEEIDRRTEINREVTDTFVNDIVDSLVAAAYLNTYKYHHSGTGTVTEYQTDTDLGTPVEAARVVGTQIEGDNTYVYKSVATITYTASYAITEHGLFDTAGAGGPPVVGGIMMDRTKFSAINVDSGDKIEFTFTISFTAGG